MLVPFVRISAAACFPTVARFFVAILEAKKRKTRVEKIRHILNRKNCICTELARSNFAANNYSLGKKQGNFNANTVINVINNCN